MSNVKRLQDCFLIFYNQNLRQIITLNYINKKFFYKFKLINAHCVRKLFNDRDCSAE